MKPFHWPALNSKRRLSPEEASEFATRVAELAKAGLPLDIGLRALADESTSGRLSRMLHELADRLEAGTDLLSALDLLGSRLPQELRGLMLAGVRTGRLADALEEYVDLQHTQSELRHRIWTTLAYPFVLLVAMTLLSAFASMFVVGHFERIFKDFDTKLPGMTVLVLYGMQPLMWFFVGLIILFVAVPFLLRWAPAIGWLWAVLYRVPMVGPLLRWGHLAQFSRLMRLFLQQDVSLPDALRITAAGLRDSYLASKCRRVAAEVERGRSLHESMASRGFPTTLIPMVQWGQQASALPDAFRAATEMSEGRARMQSTLLESLLLPIMLLTILSFIGFFVIAMFMPLICLIEKLS